MPLTKITAVNENVAWALWNINEKEDELVEMAQKLNIIDDELTEIRHPQKRLEWLAGKICLAQLLTNFDLAFSGMYKDLNGKPHLNNQMAYISLTHNFPYAAAIFNTKEKVGIDIELVKDKILRIAPRFMNNEELEVVKDNAFRTTCFWTAKEVIYKAIGVKGVVFSEDLNVKVLTNDWQKLVGHAHIDGKLYDFRLNTYLFEKHVVCINY